MEVIMEVFQFSTITSAGGGGGGGGGAANKEVLVDQEVVEDLQVDLAQLQGSGNTPPVSPSSR